ncbi:MAG TPA: redoxin family protein [Candidatus Acidoferrum sp.]|jgi:thiol-disulfide isomerase/thioredoxin|nr:redoxin family protein [Candidatus Acidoferrum sp.]
MKPTQMNWAACFSALAAGAMLAQAAGATLKVGDTAPKLKTGKWVQGEPVAEFQKGKAYIVEFWATWCGPCRASIPHLNEIYTKYEDKGLIVIGQNCWERDESLVAPFVKDMGKRMTYRVALDDKRHSEKGTMAETWMEAAGQSGIPTAFLIDTKGSIAWIGHPMELKEQVIDDVLAGKYDVQKAATEYDQQQKNQAQLRTISMAMNRAMQKKDWDEAAAKVDEAAKLLPEDERDHLDAVRFDILLGKEDYPAAYRMATKISDANQDNAMLQNELAWRIATDDSIKQRDLALAEKIARRATKASEEKEPGILDTLARVMFMQGKKEDAIALQEKAVGLADGDLKASLQKSLDSYKKGELAEAE